MLDRRRITITILCVALIESMVFAQAARTPYSSFGIGEYFGPAMVHNQGMAGVGISNPQYWFLNNQNPALLPFNTLTVFEAGYIGEVRKVKGNESEERNGNGNLNYLALGVPVKPGRWSSSGGLMPYTNVNYKIEYLSSVVGSASDTIVVLETGSGGINEVFWSNGVRINKDFSLGLKASYLFSSIDNDYTNTLLSSDQISQYEVTLNEKQYYSDFTFTAGAAFNKDSITRNNYKINIGAVYTFKSNIRTTFSQQFERSNSFGVVDTLVISKDQITQSVFPPGFGVGASFGKGEYWLIGADFVYLDYLQFQDFQGQNPGTQAAWKASLGGEFTPNPNSVSSYFNRVTYRTGVSLENYPYLINGEAVRDFGINFGFSLPVSRISSIDMAFKFGTRGDVAKNTIEESYFKIYLGVTFNDQWFIKRRFD
ncbi:MAG: hypothetical protein HC811_02545 [Flammeovirgaceae bacterium]|nr:hypothetical protein [Flammeovirgaceae bacterium]